jgi:amino acid adenylation domain-containing protein
MTAALEPLTAAQRKLILHHRLYPQDASFNLAFAFRISGEIDLDRLRDVLRKMLRVTRAWNTTFSDQDGVARPVLHGSHGPNAGEHTVEILPLRGDDEARLIKELARRADQPIPPERWPLVEFTLYDGEVAAYFTILCSHLVGDAYTFYNFSRELTRLYADPTAVPVGVEDDPITWLPEPPATPEAIEHFRRELGGLTSLLPEQLDIRGDTGVLTGVRHRISVDAEQAAFVGQRVEELGVSTFAFFLGIHLLLLGTLTGRHGLVVGIPLANRRGARQRRAYGYFVNTLPLTVDLSQHETFAALCVWLRQRVQGLVRHQGFDLTTHAHKVFNSAQPRSTLGSTFTYYKEPLQIILPDCAVEPLELSRNQIMFPLTLNVENHGQRYTLHLEHADEFEAALPPELLEHLLDTVLADPGASLSTIRAVSRVEEQRINDLVNSGRSFATPDSIVAAFEAVVACHADRVAVEDGSRRWTYDQLDRSANRLARRLLQEAPGNYVAVAMNPGCELIVTLLAVLKAGKAYVPLDPTAPSGLIRHIVGQFYRLPVVAYNGAFALEDYPDQIEVQGLLARAADEPDQPHPSTDRRDDTAYIIFTSGTTGEPKGVRVSHANVTRLFAAAAEHFDFGAEDTWCLFHSYAFDFSVWEMYGALLHGGRLAIVSGRVRRSPAEFLAFLCQSGVTVLNQTPSAFRQLVAVLTPAHAEQLAVRHVVFGGEALHFEMLRKWYAVMGDSAALANMYGITETTVHVTYHQVDEDQAHHESHSVIGKPLADMTVRVVDADRRPCPVGVAGEILVGGAGVAQGYLNAPELTDSRFIGGDQPWERLYRTGDLAYVRADGNLVYLGRIDQQVQIRGYRVELGEVEAALLAIDGIRECAVRLDTRNRIKPRLVAYVVESNRLRDRDIRAVLKQLLPAYMIPACYVRLDSLPLTVHGKIDDTALPPPNLKIPAQREQPKSAHGRAALGDVGLEVAEIWQRVLPTADFGYDDNFFDIGGTSMHVAEVHHNLKDHFGAVGLQMIDLFEYTTVNTLSKYIAEKMGS